MDRRETLRTRSLGTRRRARTGRIWPWVMVFAALPLGLIAGSLLRPEPARPELSDLEINFGTLRSGESAERIVTLRNAGETALQVAAARLDAAAGGLRLTDDGCSGRSILGGGECGLRVSFDPSADGEFFAKLALQLTSDGASLPSLPAVALLGRAASSRLEASPETADYGTVTVGQWGPRHVVELTNAGTAPLRVRSVLLRGLAAADFVRVGGDCAGLEINPQSSCRIEFDFVPTTEGERRAELAVESDADSAGAMPELVGVGLEPRPGLSVSPVVLDFGPMRADTLARKDAGRRSGGIERELRLLNDGDAPLRLEDARLTRGDAGFQLDASDCARGTLAPRASCRLRIIFRPRAEGETTSVVEIQHDAGSGPARVPLTGIGTLPRLEISESPLFVGRVAVGRVGDWHELELRNAGSADLVISSLYLDGLDKRSFEMAADGCRGVVPPGTSCTAQFRMKPRRKGPQRVELRVRHDGPGAEETITVNGLGI